jgi:hypothetical protein
LKHRKTCSIHFGVTFKKEQHLENGSLITLIVIAASLLVLNLIATYIVLNTHFEVKKRRLYQLLFIWLLPYLGGLFAILINREDYFEERRLKKVGNDSNISESDATSMAVGADHHGGR